MSVSRLNAMKNRLLQRRDEIARVLADNSESGAPVELDQTRVGRLSRIDALQNQEMAKETERRRNAEIGRIGAALQRMEEGEYGYCVTCGDEIAIKRLELDPSVAVCIGCASPKH